MNQTDNKNKESKKRDWLELGVKSFTPIATAMLIAWAGYISNIALTSISEKQETARLLTELQIRREQAESELRKDVFDQTLQSFLLKDQSREYSLFGMSKQMVRLELLSLNFGDSLSLSPLFTEFREDLKRLKPDDAEIQDFEESKGDLRKRLYSLASRVASSQVSSLVKHGASKQIEVPLINFDNTDGVPCATLLYEDGFPWPERKLQHDLGIYDENYRLSIKDEELNGWLKENEISLTDYRMVDNEERMISLGDITRYLDIYISNINHCDKSLKVMIVIYKRDSAILEPPIRNEVTGRGDLSTISKEGFQIEIERKFKLDYFNFPMVDNTRLENNHRFAIVLDDFDLKSEKPKLELTLLIFPSEYASLRDRPGRQESRKLLQDALSDE